MWAVGGYGFAAVVVSVGHGVVMMRVVVVVVVVGEEVVAALKK